MRYEGRRDYIIGVSTTGPRGLCLGRDVLVALNIGTFFTVVLGVLEAAQIAPKLAAILLRPGLYLSDVVTGSDVASAFVLVVFNGIVYATVPFAIMRLRSGKKRSRGPVLERRSAQRIPLTTPVFVYGHVRGEPFWEFAQTLNVSKSGGLLALTAKLATAQNVVLTNPATDEDLVCRVARSPVAPNGKTFVGVEFLQESEDFWHLPSRSAA